MNDLKKYQLGLRNGNLIDRERKNVLNFITGFFKGILHKAERTPDFYKAVELLLFIITMLFIGFIVYINY